MKSKILFYIAVGLAFLTVSCDSYLDKEPDDMQTIEGVFAKRSTTEQYLANAYAYLIAESGKPTYSSNMWENVKNWKMANWKPGLPKPDISM